MPSCLGDGPENKWKHLGLCWLGAALLRTGSARRGGASGGSVESSGASHHSPSPLPRPRPLPAPLPEEA
eukprot:753436-Alexandrium_andersonii.AAC.1